MLRRRLSALLTLLTLGCVFLTPTFAQAQRRDLSGFDGTQAPQTAQQTAAPVAVTPTATPTAATVTLDSQVRALTPVKPDLSVQIPGLTFSNAYNDGDDIVVPFMAQYIGAVYQYMLGISTLVAIIVVICGGFLYLLGQTTGSTVQGLNLIKDAVAGLIVLYCSYVILYAVNPNLINLQPIRLTRIQSVPIGDHSGDDGVAVESTGTGTGGGAACRLRYNQGVGVWAHTPYGLDPAMMSDATSHPSNITTFQEGGCGPTAVASVLAFYGLQISVSDRVPAPGTGMHAVDPIDVGIMATYAGYRHLGGGTTGKVARYASRFFPQFDSTTISKTNTAAVLGALSNGHPLVFSCSSVHLFSDDAATQPIASSRDGHTDLYRGGHYMVLSGVVSDQILRVHDVGNGNTKTIKMDELQARCGALVLIQPKPSYQESVTTNWGTIQVQMRLPAAAGQGGQCTTTAARSTTSADNGARPGAVTSVPFTYRPASGGTAADWPDNSARLLFPSRLSGTSNPTVHAFIYLHGDNSGDKTPEQRYITYLRPALEAVAGSKNIVIMTPHHNNSGNDYPGFSLSEFYTTALAALQTALPGVTVSDTVVGGHSGATCQGGPVIIQAVGGATPNLRGIIAYDGCAAGRYTAGGQGLDPTNFTPAAGVAEYIDADLSGMGHGNVSSPTGGTLQRNLAIRQLWGLSSQTCPPCAQAVGGTTCYAPAANFQRADGGELIEFETSAGHDPSVGVMTNIALCAFYRNNTTGN